MQSTTQEIASRVQFRALEIGFFKELLLFSNVLSGVKSMVGLSERLPPGRSPREPVTTRHGWCPPIARSTPPVRRRRAGSPGGSCPSLHLGVTQHTALSALSGHLQVIVTQHVVQIADQVSDTHAVASPTTFTINSNQTFQYV